MKWPLSIKWYEFLGMLALYFGVGTFFILPTILSPFDEMYVGNEETGFGYVDDEVLDHLFMCESGGDVNAINPNDPDTPSYGPFQFKVQTAHMYLKRYDMHEGWNDEELVELLHNYTFTRNLAETIILTEEKGWRNWYNCLNEFYA